MKDRKCHLYEENEECFSIILRLLTLAVEEGLEYKDARDGKSSTGRTRRAKSPPLGTVEHDSKEKSAIISSDRKPVSSARKKSTPRTDKAEKGERSKTKETKEVSKITPDKKKARAVSPLVNNGSNKRQKKAEHVKEHTSPSYHMTQTQDIETIMPSYNRRSPNSNINGPLSGYSFFYSGVEHKRSINQKIIKLGGEVLNEITSSIVDKSFRRVFFLSDYASWRKPKYILAASLGVPMLHFQWLDEIQKLYEDCGTAKIFNSSLYLKYRLPMGLDLSAGVFVLQRATNARDWLRPGFNKEGGRAIFEGMKIALALDTAAEAAW